MKDVLKTWLKGSFFKIILVIIFIFLNMYFLTIPPKIIGEIIDLFSDITTNKILINEKIIYLVMTSIILLLVRLPWRTLAVHSALSYEKILKDSLFDHFSKVKMECLQNIKNGEIMAYFTKDVNETRRCINQLTTMGLRTIATIIIAIYTMMNDVNIKLTIITLIPLFITIILVIVVKNFVQKASEKSRKAFSELSEYVQESTDGIRTIKAYSGEEMQIKNFEIKNKVLRNSGIKVGIFSTLLSTIINLGFGISIGISIIYGSRLVINQAITIGDLIAFNGYILLFVNPIIWLPQIFTKYKIAKISFDRLHNVFELETEEIDNKKVRKGKIHGDIKITDLTFNYPANIEVALKNINLEIKEGQTLGIIGTIGSGKTTLMNLLLKLYNVPNGKITIGNQDINEIKLSELRNSICYITQEHFLFSTTIKENIGLFREGYTDEAIIESTKSAMIADDIERMERGINTVVGERGIDLSGGQKQRVVISRAFLQKSNIVIFDDTFSALDNKTEEFLLRNIRELTKGKTCMIISNRISDIKDADNIIVLDDGEIIQSGTHKELVKENGLYKKFYIQQSSKKQEEVGELLG